MFSFKNHSYLEVEYHEYFLVAVMSSEKSMNYIVFFLIEILQFVQTKPLHVLHIKVLNHYFYTPQSSHFWILVYRLQESRALVERVPER